MIIIYSYSYYNYYYLFQTEDRLAHALTGKFSAAPPLSLSALPSVSRIAFFRSLDWSCRGGKGDRSRESQWRIV